MESLKKYFKRYVIRIHKENPFEEREHAELHVSLEFILTLKVGDTLYIPSSADALPLWVIDVVNYAMLPGDYIVLTERSFYEDKIVYDAAIIRSDNKDDHFNYLNPDK